MKRMRLMTARKAGFSRKHLRVRKELPKRTAAYLKQKSSFLVAAFSLAAFVTGNMMGEHGWYAFWKAALGQYDDSLITYTGFVAPVALVPDYSKWSTYGGNGEEHTFREVPKDNLMSLPAYNQSEQKKDFDHSQPGDVYSIGFMASYETGAEGSGSHDGIDIRVPEGTPVRSIANGIVTRVDNDPYGFGKLVVVRHPHVPDPDHPDYETVIYSNYAHLSAQTVSVGDVVQKGQQVGLSGKTGFATGPHLHFQIDKDTAPWHPYWTFTASEARDAGMNTTQAINAGLHKERGYEFSLNPMLIVQSNLPPAKNKFAWNGKTTTVATKTTTRTSTRRTVTATTIASTAAQRRAQRLAQNARIVAAHQAAASSSSAAPVDVVQMQTVATQTPEAPSSAAPVIVVPQSTTNKVSSIGIQVAREYTGREWMTIRLTLLDSTGRTTTENGLNKDLYLRTAYGEAEFDPPVLSALDFKNGTAQVRMLPRGRRTVVIEIQPFKSMSAPIEFSGN